MKKILVVGSMNMDLVLTTSRYPKKGETIIGDGFQLIPGGKGANQACAIGKLGGEVKFLGACGYDYYGDVLLKNLKNSGVNIDGVTRTEDPTGVAAITIEGDGDNRIIVVPGSNAKLTPEMINKYQEDIQDSYAVLLQMEIPLETIIYTINLAKKFDIKVILDPAPAQILPEELYNKIDYILPNEVELKQLTSGYNMDTQQQKAEELLRLGVGGVVLTNGGNGVFYYNKNEKKHYAAKQVNPVDTTAAGDAFAGSFVLGLQQGRTVNESIEFSCIVSALVVRKIGAQSSLPSKEEVASFRGKVY